MIPIPPPPTFRAPVIPSFDVVVVDGHLSDRQGVRVRPAAVVVAAGAARRRAADVAAARRAARGAGAAALDEPARRLLRDASAHRTCFKAPCSGILVPKVVSSAGSVCIQKAR